MSTYFPENGGGVFQGDKMDCPGDGTPSSGQDQFFSLNTEAAIPLVKDRTVCYSDITL